MGVKNQLKVRLIEAGKSQKWLAEEFDVSETQVSNWVGGRRTPPLEVALKIARKLNRPVEDIWQLDEEQES